MEPFSFSDSLEDDFLDLVNNLIDQPLSTASTDTTDTPESKNFHEPLSSPSELELLSTIESRLPSTLPTEEEARYARSARVKKMRERAAGVAARALTGGGLSGGGLSGVVGGDVKGDVKEEVQEEEKKEDGGDGGMGDIPKVVTTTVGGMDAGGRNVYDGTMVIAEMTEEQLTAALDSMPELPKGSSKEEKKHRRLIRNRMAAQLSRERKRMAMEVRETWVHDICIFCQRLGMGEGSDSDLSVSGVVGRSRVVSVSTSASQSNSGSACASVSSGTGSSKGSPSAPGKGRGEAKARTYEVGGGKGERKRTRTARGRGGEGKIRKIAMIAGMGLCAILGVGIITRGDTRTLGNAVVVAPPNNMAGRTEEVAKGNGIQHRKLMLTSRAEPQAADEHKKESAVEEIGPYAWSDVAAPAVVPSTPQIISLTPSPGTAGGRRAYGDEEGWYIDPVENFPGRWKFGGRNTPYTYQSVRQVYPRTGVHGTAAQGAAL
ncbi:hypothetical protein TrRE_jg6940, partial [Triparma retinervis]